MSKARARDRELVRGAIALERERCAKVCDELAEKTQDAFRIIKEKAAILGMWELDRLSEHHRVYQHAAKKIREKKEE